MRVMIILKASPESEAGIPPGEALLTAMQQYNRELAAAGILLDAAGLQSSAKGHRVRFEPGRKTVIDGPFAETKELIAGFWLWQVRSMAEAIEWVQRCPNPLDETHEVEIRQVFEAGECSAAAR